MKYALVDPNWDELRKLDENLLFKVMTGKVAEDKPELYEAVFCGECDDADCATERGRAALAERLFERFNIGDHGGLRIRSLSVGDLLVFDGGPTLLCAPAGWDEIDFDPKPDFSLTLLDAARRADREIRKRDLEEAGLILD